MGTSKGFLAGDTDVSWYRSWANGGEFRQRMSFLERAKLKHGDGSSYGQDTVSASMRGRLTNQYFKHKQPLAVTYCITLCPHGFDPFGKVRKISPKLGTISL